MSEELKAAQARIAELEREARNDAVAYRAAIERQNELRAELAALKAQEPVAEIALSDDGYKIGLLGALRNHRLPIGTKLYAAPVVSAEQHGVTDERAEFEKWGETLFYTACFERHESDEYAGRGLQGAWLGWQARAMLAAAPAPAQPVSAQPAGGLDLDMVLPCDIKLPGGMMIGKGCKLSTLLLSFRNRGDDVAWRQRFSVPVPYDPVLLSIRPKQAKAEGCE